MSKIFPLGSFYGEAKDREETFETLFRDFSKEVDYHRKAKNFHSLIQVYLLHFKDNLGTNVKSEEFLELLSQVPVLCNEFLQTSTLKPNLSSNDVASCNIESKSQNIESASLCFDAVLSCLEAFSITKQCTVVLKISLNILCQGFMHCKDSEVIYGDLLEQFAEQLGSFFKKMENLQVVVLQQLDEINIEACLENDSHINCIILEMGNLCQVVFSLDADIAIELWNKYIRFITSYTSLKKISNVNSVSTNLVLKNIEILQLIQYSQGKNPEEDAELAAKLSFYLDALSNLMNLACDSFRETILEFKSLLLNLFDCLLSHCSPFFPLKSSQDIIISCLTRNTFPLFSHLYSDEEFQKSVILTAVGENNTHFSHLLLKLCALQFMENSSLEIKKDFFKNILSDCVSGSSEDDAKFLSITIPQCILTKVDSEKSLTLYQFIYEQLTEFLKLLPDFVIQEMENVILDHLVSASDVAYLLISDTWMLRLRCGSLEFLKSQCNSALKYVSMKNVNSVKIENFIKRILRFLPISDKEKFLKEFSTVKFICDSRAVQHRYGVPYSITSSNEETICSDEQVMAMMSKLNENCKNDSLQLIEKACVCLELCTCFLSISNSSETLQFIEFACELFKTDVYDIQIAVLTFIEAMSRKSLPEYSQDFGNITVMLAQLFSLSMHSNNYIVRYRARNVFYYFAKHTSHTKIIQETMRRDSTLKPIMKAHINAFPEKILSEEEKIVCLEQQIQTMDKMKIEIPQKIIGSLQQIFSRGNFEILI